MQTLDEMKVVIVEPVVMVVGGEISKEKLFNENSIEFCLVEREIMQLSTRIDIHTLCIQYPWQDEVLKLFSCCWFLS